MFLVDVDCFMSDADGKMVIAEDKTTYRDAVCTWVEAAKEGDGVSMANAYRMFNPPGSRPSSP